MFELLRAFKSRFSEPLAYSQGFVKMGLGISSRFRRFNRPWGAHFSASKEAILNWQERISADRGSSLAVLGAGRLYDLPLAELANCFTNFHFIDYDPLCQPVWARAAKQQGINYNACCFEVTSTLESWQQRLAKLPADYSWKQQLEIICSLTCSETPSAFAVFCRQQQPDCILSLNMLSQIPLMWQGMVERHLLRHFPKQLVEQREQEWINAYLSGARELLRLHLRELSESGAKHLLLLSDMEYLFYTEEQELSQKTADTLHTPFIWKAREDKSKEQGGVEPLVGDYLINQELALSATAQSSLRQSVRAMDALCNINLENPKLLKTIFPNYEYEYGASWLWHILPEPETNSADCSLHRVRAIALEKKC